MHKIDWKKLVEEREKKRRRGMRSVSAEPPSNWGEGNPYDNKPNNGLLDNLFDGLEDEIERVNKKLGLEYERRWCDE